MLDFNNAGPQVRPGEAEAPAAAREYDLDAIRDRLAASAPSWLPGMFPNAVEQPDRRTMRMGGLDGRPPSGEGSCIIQLTGPHAGSAYDHATGEPAGPIDLIGHATGLRGRELWAEAAQIAGTGATIAPKHQAPAKKDRAGDVDRILAGCRPLAGTIGETYLQSRGLSDPGSPDLLFHDDPTIRGESGRVSPAMVAVLRDRSGQPIGGIHRTFLLDDGSDKGPLGKKGLGPWSGGSVRLAPVPADGVLGIAEGIETALSATAIFGVPCWAALSAGGLKAWRPPEGVKRVIIFADAGKAGQDAAHELAGELRAASIGSPIHGDDFNHDLRKGAKMADYVEAASTPPAESLGSGALTYDDFWWISPLGKPICCPTQEVWATFSVNEKLPPKMAGKFAIPAAKWLAKHRSLDQITWVPGEPEIIRDKIIIEGGIVDRPGLKAFNLYRAPAASSGDPLKAWPWLRHVYRVYPLHWRHIVMWLAYRCQRPGDKINHALVLGGNQGIGKDTILKPAIEAIGRWNCKTISPMQLTERFNEFARSVLLIIQEARNLGDLDRYAFYEQSKIYCAEPPPVLRVDEKNLRAYSILNACGVIFTTNHKENGLYLPPDDRRNYVAWSEKTKDDFTDDYWTDLHGWLDREGNRHVAALLSALNTSKFNPKAPPEKTAAWWDIVDAERPPEESQLADLLDKIQRPDAITLHQLISLADAPLAEILKDRKNRRQWPSRMKSAGYLRVRNPNANDGEWKIGERRHAVYALDTLSEAQRNEAAKALAGRSSG